MMCSNVGCETADIYCKGMCRRHYSQEYQRRNRKALSDKQRERYHDPDSNVRQNSLDYYERHREGILEQARARYLADRRTLNDRRREYRRRNPQSHRASNARRRSAANSGMTPIERTISVEYRKAIEGDPCYYCGDYSTVMHVDHDVPLVRGGTDHWWNLVHACATCNLSKHTMTGAEFMQTRNQKVV